MEIGIGSSENKQIVYFTSTSKAFREKYTEFIMTTRHNQFTKMLELASWVNNEVGEECFFYMD